VQQFNSPVMSLSNRNVYYTGNLLLRNYLSDQDSEIKVKRLTSEGYSKGNR
jgi:hypothetical protein